MTNTEDQHVKSDHEVAQSSANHLADETSPYLLMHAHNPVAWYPWGEEALAKARRENKPIFLSIGYSSCYWCHVMERESFTDDEIAAFLNAHFVSIKVDREERPDLDDIYMTGVQLLTGSGGWPMSVFLTPEGKPFHGGTYFPPRLTDNRQHLGFMELLERIEFLWRTRREEVEESAHSLTEAIKQQLRRPNQNKDVIGIDQAADHALKALVNDFDPVAGGFGFSPVQPKSPKFPEPAKLDFLLDCADAGNSGAAKMLLTTLDSMARGGIYDHLGGGFHRYSTDRFWWVPHFEKMLYDNGQLASSYARAYTLTGREDFANVARGICDYVLREMTAPQGGYYSALDAETDAEEGKFYVWTDEELSDALNVTELELNADVFIWRAGALQAQLPFDTGQNAIVARYYGTGRQPIFEGRHVLMLGKPLEAIAKARGTTVNNLLTDIEPVRAKLLAARDQRKRPLTDTKILTSWNGLMIAGMADTGHALGEEKHMTAAVRAAEFILAELRQPDGRLLRTFRNDKAKLNAYLDDYAFLVRGLIAIHRATQDARWLTTARELTDQQIELFWDNGEGGFYFTSHDHETLIARGKKPTDGALPAGNSVSATNLLYMAEATGDLAYRERAKRTIEALLPWAERSPAHTCGTAAAAAELLRQKTSSAP